MGNKADNFTVYVISLEGENFHSFHRFLLTMNVLPLKNFCFILKIIITMALLKYFKIEECVQPLPNPSGPLNQHLSRTAIEEANKKLQQLCILLQNVSLA